MNAFRRYILLLILIYGNLILAQKKDTAYIQPYYQKFRIMGSISTSYVQVDDGTNHYTPNYPFTTGIGLAIRNTIISLDAGYGFIPLKDKKVYGRSKMTDFQIHRYGNNAIVDLYFQNYKGFYSEKRAGRIDRILPDMRVTQIGTEYTYLLNGKQFSSKAAFDLNEIQKRSAGSWLFGSGAYYSSIRGLQNTEEDDGGTLENIQLGINAGYGYSWVLSDRWMLSVMAKGGVNFGNTPENLSKVKMEIFPTAYARFSGNYHKNDWGLSLSVFIGNKQVSPVNKNTISLTTLSMQMTYVKHIDYLFRKIK